MSGEWKPRPDPATAGEAWSDLPGPRDGDTAVRKAAGTCASCPRALTCASFLARAGVATQARPQPADRP